jgi:Mrp family chromosome partitioning ATPase
VSRALEPVYAVARREQERASSARVEPAAIVALREPAPVPRHSLHATLEALAASGVRTLVATGSGRHAGTSSFVEAAGRAIAASGRGSVVLVDACAQHPSLHRRFGLPCERGLGEALDELYGFDITREDAGQFGVGDWLEVLRAQERTGRLTVCGDGRTYALAIVRGRACALSCVDAPAAERLGERLVRGGHLSEEQRDLGMRIHEQTARPLGEVLSAFGFVGSAELVEGLQQQCVHGLVDLISMRAPECRFEELAESHLGATGPGGRTMAAPRGLERVLRSQVLEYLKQPFLRSQLPSFLRDTGAPGLRALVAGRRACDLSRPARQAALGLLLARLTRSFDFVLVDAPAAGASGEGGVAEAIAAHADGAVLVVPPGGAPLHTTRDTIEDFRRAGVRLLGVVMCGAAAGSRGSR